MFGRIVDELADLMVYERWGVGSTFLYVERNTRWPSGNTLGSPGWHSRFSPCKWHWLMLIKRPCYRMVVWVTLQRHPSVFATHTADAVMPYQGIRCRIPTFNVQPTSHTCLGEHWRAAKRMRGGRVVVKTRLARWLELKAGSLCTFGLFRRFDLTLYADMLRASISVLPGI